MDFLYSVWIDEWSLGKKQESARHCAKVLSGWASDAVHMVHSPLACVEMNRILSTESLPV